MWSEWTSPSSQKSPPEPSFPSEKIAARFRSFISTSTRHIYRFSAHPPVPEFHFLAGCRCRCHPDPEKDRIFLTLQWGGGELKRTLRRIKEGWKILGTMFGHVWYDTSFPRRRPVYLVFRDKPRKTLWALVPSVSAKEYLLLREETILFVDSKVRDVWRTPSELGFVIF